jgi:hypothetical protein
MHGEARRSDVVNGHTVYQILSDYQSRTNGGDGWLRILSFHPTEDKIYVNTYSPYLNSYENDLSSEFAIDYDMTSSKRAGAPILLSAEKRFSTFYTFGTYWRLNRMAPLALNNQLTATVLTVIPEKSRFSTFWTGYMKRQLARTALQPTKLNRCVTSWAPRF